MWLSFDILSHIICDGDLPTMFAFYNKLNGQSLTVGMQLVRRRLQKAVLSQVIIIAQCSSLREGGNCPGISSFICKYDSDLADHLRFARKVEYCIFCFSVLEHTSR